MAETTGIAWTDHTHNPWIGCTAVSPACAKCYAKTLVERWGDDPAQWPPALRVQQFPQPMEATHAH